MVMKEIALYPAKINKSLDQDEFHQTSISMARVKFFEAARQDRQLMPAFVSYSPFGMFDLTGPVVGFIPVRWEGEDEKTYITNAIRKMLSDVRATRYSFFTEAWFCLARRKDELEEILKAGARNREDRQEMVFIITVDRETPFNLATSFLIERPWDGGTAKLNELENPQVDYMDTDVLDLLR